jgi:chaperone required for assembly of F1-ATPase
LVLNWFLIFQENERLWELQRELWDPMLQWFQSQYDIKLPIVAGAITPPDVPEQTLAVLRNQLMSYRFDALLGIYIYLQFLFKILITN